MSMAAHIIGREDEQERVHSLLARVSRAYEAARENTDDFSRLHEAITELEQLIFSIDSDFLSLADCGVPSPEMLARVNEAYSFWEKSLEWDFAQRLVHGKACLNEYCLFGRFRTLVQRELALMDRAIPKRTLVWGSGALPLSAILLHSATGGQVDCVACDSSCIGISREVLERCHSGGVRVLGDCQSGYDFRAYDLIVVGVHLAANRSMFKTLRKRCRPGCYILYRTGKGLRQLLHRGIPGVERRGFYIRGEQLAEGNQTVSSLLLQPAAAAASDVRLEWLQAIDSERAKQLLQLMNRTLAEETTIGFPGPIDDETGRVVMQQLKQDVESGRRHVLVAYKDQVIVGQLILTPNSSPNHRHIVELTRGTIDPSFRGGGLALRAFQEVAKKCEELGREVICLDVRAGTHAAVWWQYFGFKQYGLLQDYSRVGNRVYQGLYLTQTTAELKQRLETLGSCKQVPVQA
jgi:L-amino acid N-acyltransferase YncA